MTEQSTIYKIHQRLQQKIKGLDNQLIGQLQPSLKRIEQVRYQRFSACIAGQKSVPHCYQQSTHLELKPDFEKQSNILEACLRRMKSSWEKGTDQCFSQYEKGLRKTLDAEINRVLKLLEMP